MARALFFTNKVLGYLYHGYLRCGSCIKPYQKDVPVLESDIPYCEETCDHCGKPLACDDLTIEGCWFKKLDNGRCMIYQRGICKNITSVIPESEEEARQILSDLNINTKKDEDSVGSLDGIEDLSELFDRM